MHYFQSVQILLQLISPFARHIACELWEFIGGTGMISDLVWPEFDMDKVEENIELAVQVNSRNRAKMVVAPDTTEEQIWEEAHSLESIQQWIQGKVIKRTIYVPGKLVNLVLDIIKDNPLVLKSLDLKHAGSVSQA